MALDMRKVQQDFAKEGAFHVIRRYVREGTIDSGTASQWSAQVFAALNEKVAEAKKEVRHIAQVLDRLEHVCKGGARAAPHAQMETTVQSLAHHFTAFDGWMISLYETELTMLSYVLPARAKARPIEMAESMEALAQKRLAEQRMGLKAPELFKLG
jgi:hypothetical protein